MKSEAKPNIVFAVVATDVACFRIIDDKLHVLLGKAPAYSPFAGEWALIGGMIRPKETAEETVDRLLTEKASIKNIYKEQIYTFSKINRDPRGRVVSIAYLALCADDPQNGESSLETKWVAIDRLPRLAYDHKEIFEHILEKLRFSVSNTNTAKFLIKPEFTLSELQKVYEAVLEKGMDKRNFRKRILGQNILKETKKIKKEGVMRPAKIFIFK